MKDEDATAPTASVVVCAYTEARWALMESAVASIAALSPAADRTILVIDNNPRLLERAAEAFPEADVVANRFGPGLSGARNTGVHHADTDLVAFLDDDATCAPDWLGRLLPLFADPATVVAGSVVEPVWEQGRPRWFPDPFLWVVGCTHNGMPSEPGSVRNVVGASMIARRTALLELGGFAEDLGRIGTLPVGCEETELCIRARQRIPGAEVLFEPRTSVRHTVPGFRATPRYFLSRCWSEGRSKAAVTRLVGSTDGLAAERSYTRETLPAAVLAGLRDAGRGDPAGLARAWAVIAGLLVTAAGYLFGRLRGS